jgi:hypothetical protein
MYHRYSVVRLDGSKADDMIRLLSGYSLRFSNMGKHGVADSMNGNV